MTHRGGLSLSIVIWRIGGGGAKFPFALRPKNSLGGPAWCYGHPYLYRDGISCHRSSFNMISWAYTISGC